MTIRVFGIRTSSAAGTQVDFVNRDSRETIAQVIVTPTHKPGEFLACETGGNVFGYRHASVEAALDFVVDKLGVAAVFVDSAHPAVRGFVNA